MPYWVSQSSYHLLLASSAKLSSTQPATQIMALDSCLSSADTSIISKKIDMSSKSLNMSDRTVIMS
jgi:hypothetical protein